eukprot:4688887-Pyramimonas_sp.AAC.1
MGRWTHHDVSGNEQLTTSRPAVSNNTHPLDSCLFVSYEEGSNCGGFILLYVDDVRGGGDRQPGSNYSAIIEAVKSKFKFRNRGGQDGALRIGPTPDDSLEQQTVQQRRDQHPDADVRLRPQTDRDRPEEQLQRPST